MKRIIFLINTAIILFSTNAYSQDKRYIVFIGSGEVGDPIITWQKVGEEVQRPSIFTKKILEDNTLPTMVIASEAAGGQIPPGVERFVRNYRQLNNGEEPVIILLNKESLGKINEQLKTELGELGLIVSDNKISVKTTNTEQPNTLRTRFNNKLSDMPTIGTLIIKDLIQAFACYYAIHISGPIQDPAIWQMLTFISVNLVVTTGISLFIEEYIKVRSAAASVFNNGIDDTFDAVNSLFQKIHDHVGDIMRPQGQKNLLRMSVARLASNGNMASSTFNNLLKKTTKFLIRGDMAFQAFCVSLPILFVGWGIWGTPTEAFNFANEYFNINSNGLDVVVLTGIVLTIVNSISGVPVDVANSYLNKIGAFSNRASIWFTLVIEAMWQKDKLGQAGLVLLNMIVNKLVTIVSLPGYFLLHWLSPSASKESILENSQKDLEETINELNTVLNSAPDIVNEAEIIARLQKRGRSKLGIGALDKLFAKPDIQLVLDLTYLLQKYMDDGTISKAEISNKHHIRHLLEDLNILRNNYEKLSGGLTFSEHEKAIILEAEHFVNKARDFNAMPNSFWKECGRTIKKSVLSLLKFMGWSNTKTAEKKNIEELISRACSASTNIWDARYYLSMAKELLKKLPKDDEQKLLEHNIKIASIKVDNKIKMSLVERIQDFFQDQQIIITAVNDEELIEAAVDYVVNVKHGKMDSDEITEITLGDVEVDFENSLLNLAKESPNKKILRLEILCNDNIKIDGELINASKFFTNEYVLNFARTLIGDDVYSSKLYAEDLLKELTPIMDKSIINKGIINLATIRQTVETGIIQKK